MTRGSGCSRHGDHHPQEPTAQTPAPLHAQSSRVANCSLCPDQQMKQSCVKAISAGLSPCSSYPLEGPLCQGELPCSEGPAPLPHPPSLHLPVSLQGMSYARGDRARAATALGSWSQTQHLSNVRLSRTSIAQPQSTFLGSSDGVSELRLQKHQVVKPSTAGLQITAAAAQGSCLPWGHGD